MAVKRCLHFGGHRELPNCFFHLFLVYLLMLPIQLLFYHQNMRYQSFPLALGKWRFTNWFTNNYLWSGTTYLRFYPHFAKLFYLHWLNLYRSTKFSCWQWCSSIPTHKLSSLNNLLQVQSYHWISTLLSALGLEL